MKTTDNKNNRINHFRELFRCGCHPTATHAAILMLISSTQQFPSSSSDPNIAAHYTLCAFTTEDVLSFCVDGTRVLVVDVAKDKGSDDFSSSKASTCLVVDDRGSIAPLARTAWSSTSPPNHFIFASMHYQRALDWVQQQQSKSLTNVTQIGDRFLRKCSALSSLDLSPLTTAREIGRCFLYGCSG
eukprot:PhM_4_TR15615/c3_g1_i4/m.68554